MPDCWFKSHNLPGMLEERIKENSSFKDIPAAEAWKSCPHPLGDLQFGGLDESTQSLH